jgi:transcriptional regulator with XRE-family HTH domain
MKDQEIAAIVCRAIDLASEEQGWSRTQLGRRKGVSKATIYRWYGNSEQRHHIGMLDQVFTYAGQSLDDQLGLAG